jgi:acetolactate synthase regulatory subunit
VTAIIQTPLAAPAIGPTRRLSVATTGDADVLLRVLGLLRRRGFVVWAVEFRAGDRHAPERLELSVESPGRCGPQLVPWLMNVVGVTEVAEQ